jgi:hypothetical protein
MLSPYFGDRCLDFLDGGGLSLSACRHLSERRQALSLAGERGDFFSVRSWGSFCLQFLFRLRAMTVPHRAFLPLMKP